MSTKKLEVRQQGRHYTVVDSTGRVYARENNERDATRTWRRTLKGLSKEAGRHAKPSPGPQPGAGKGDGTRPRLITVEEWERNYARTFGR